MKTASAVAFLSWVLCCTSSARAQTLEWTQQLGTSDRETSRGVSADGLGNVYITGSTQGSLVGTNVGRFDAFIAKYSELPEPGDFDGNGTCDGTDFLAWQRGESSNPLSQSDLDEWQASFGAVASSVAAASTTVPEPATGLILMLGMMTLLFRLGPRGLHRPGRTGGQKGLS